MIYIYIFGVGVNVILFILKLVLICFLCFFTLVLVPSVNRQKVSHLSSFVLLDALNYLLVDVFLKGRPLLVQLLFQVVQNYNICDFFLILSFF